MIDRATLQAKRAEYQQTMDDYQRSIYALQGAIQAVDELLALDAQNEQALTMDELKQFVGAREIGEPEALKGGA